MPSLEDPLLQSLLPDQLDLQLELGSAEGEGLRGASEESLVDLSTQKSRFLLTCWWLLLSIIAQASLCPTLSFLFMLLVGFAGFFPDRRIISHETQEILLYLRTGGC